MQKRVTGTEPKAAPVEAKKTGVKIKSVSASGSLKVDLKPSSTETLDAAPISETEGPAKDDDSLARIGNMPEMPTLSFVNGGKSDRSDTDCTNDVPAAKAPSNFNAGVKPALVHPQPVSAESGVPGRDAADKAGTATSGAGFDFSSAARQQAPELANSEKKHEKKPASSFRQLGIAAAGLSAMAIILGVLQFAGQPEAPVVQADTVPVARQNPVISGTSEAQVALTDPVKAAAVTAQASPAQSDVDAMVARMTAGTLAALRPRAVAPESAALLIAPGSEAEAPPDAAAAAAAAVSELYKLVMTATSQGQSEAYIDQLLNEAYSKNTIAVPAGLIGADGRVDTQTILGLFIAK